jgi:hypothetical protein
MLADLLDGEICRVVPTGDSQAVFA